MVTTVCPHFSTRKEGKGCYKHINLNVVAVTGADGLVIVERGCNVSEKRNIPNRGLNH
jgi:hypothetical protein